MTFTLSFLNCISTNPSPCNRDASVTRRVCHDGLKWFKDRADIKSDFRLLKAAWCSSNHKYTAFFFNKGWRMPVCFAIPGWYADSWFTIPRKLLSSETDLGAGKSRIPCKYDSLGLTPLWLTIYSANSTESPISSFFLERVKLWALHLLISSLILLCRVSISGACTRMSSTSFLTPCRPSTILSDRRQNSSLEQERPIGARRKQNQPEGRRKVVSLELSSSNGTWW